MASCYSWGLKVACLSALGRTVISSLEENSGARSRFSSLRVIVTFGGLSINYHLNTCRSGSGLFKGRSADKGLAVVMEIKTDLWQEVTNW